MKRNTLIATAMVLALLPLSATAQFTQILPPEVKEIRLEGYARLTVCPGDTTRLEVPDAKQAVNVGKVSGTRLTIKEQVRGLTLSVAPDRVMAFNPQDFSSIAFSGDFRPFDYLTIHTEDYGKVAIDGNEGDTLRSHALRLHAEDFSRIEGSIPVQYYDFDIISADHSRISLLATASDSRLARDGQSDCTQSFANSDFGTIYLGRYTVDGVLKSEDYYSVSADEGTRTINSLTDGIADMRRKLAENGQKRKVQHPWDTELDLAFGWHNWGDAIGNGLSGLPQGNGAAVNTTLNNWQLAVNIPVVNVRGFALKLGLGLEWDKYKFTDPLVTFDPTSDPMGFAAGIAASDVTRSRLKTRYVVLPVKLDFGNADGWHVSLTALPGLGWTGKNTGMRYKLQTSDGQVNAKDFTVNRYLNPYKLDVRLAVKYDWIGVYIQVSTLSVFKDGCLELFPVKFGIIL